ncbi:hypothetical protein GIB67_028796 [Kingdonia uniflora]|uniref:Uncharacterized protein n=1 Tax=Kingdonia uniflora TaxID=39325 RepID=A0A7J7LBH6_9MAGN|nr:hypothetical protein GIB67_028796 [Kingdonia uniflora]
MGLLRVASQDAVIKLSLQDMVMIEVELENGLRICKVLGQLEFEEVNKKMFEKCESLVEQCVFAVRVDVEFVNDVILVVWSVTLEGAVASIVSDPLGSLDLLTIQATQQSLSIEADGHTFVPIIPRNMTMPARKEMWFTTTRDNQRR